MSNLKVMGAKRIEVLTDMLKAKQAADKARLLTKLATHEDIIRKMEKETGLKLSSMIDRLQTAGAKVTFEYNYREPKPMYYRIKDELNAPGEQLAKKIDAYYKGVINSLWLCETLAEAKAIVEGAEYKV